MERRSFVRNAGLAGVLAAGIAPAVHAQPNIRWRLASSFPKSLDTIFGAADIMAKQVGVMTGGKFTITVAAPGEIVPAFGVDDAVRNRTVEMAHTAPYYFVGKNETFALGTAIPFGLNSRQTHGWVMEGNGMKLLREFYAQFNFINFIGGNTGAQMGGVLERLGLVPQMIPGGEIYQALEKGTIDAAEWVGPYDDEKLGLNKVAPNYAYPGFWEGGAGLEFWINNAAFNELSADYKAILEAACSHAAIEMQARYDARNPAALKKLVASGTKLFPFPKDVMEGAFKASQELYSEISAKNPAFKKIFDDYSAFRRDANLWFRFSEAGFDDFMQAQRL
jgi:TRAP-type mannitol/chloroaromatic compound transport system substrate-binding protein